ncbi:MAG TPA: GDSL-type esterase/lipase family protein [Armatimonadota bacterium]
MTASSGGKMMGDLSQVVSSMSIVQYGPALSGERWQRFDFSAGKGGGAVIVPQTLSTGDSSVTGLPTLAPAGPASAPWSAATARFGGGIGGSCSPASLNLAAAYPAWSASKPYHVEAHWKVTSTTQATLDVRIWNGPLPPAYASAASATYTRSTALWTSSARAGIAGTGTGAEIDGMAEYDALPDYQANYTAANSGITYSGRWTTVNSTERHACSAGQRFRFTVSSEWLYLRVKGSGIAYVAPPICYRIDGGAWMRTHNPSSSDAVIPLYEEGRTRGPHVVEVMVAGVYYCDAWSATDSRFMLASILMAPGGSLEPAPYPKRKVLFLGDSIMCGYMVLPTAADSTAAGRCDASQCMPALLADQMGIDAVNLSVPGMGFVLPHGAETAQPFLEQSLAGVAWKPDWQPDAIVINLGTNDSDDVKYPDSVLEAAVTDYLHSVRRMFPAAAILMLRTFGNLRTTALKAGFTAAGLQNAQWVDTAGWLDLSIYHDTTDGGHPDLAGNVKYASRVAALLSALPAPCAGDSDGDGKVTVADAIAAVRAAGGLSSAAAR